MKGTRCCFCFCCLGHSETVRNPQLVHAATCMAANGMKRSESALRRLVWRSQCLHIVHFSSLWTGCMVAKITHLWCMCISHLSVTQKDALWVPIRPLGSTNQKHSKREWLGIFFKSVFRSCTVMLRQLHLLSPLRSEGPLPAWPVYHFCSSNHQ